MQKFTQEIRENYRGHPVPQFLNVLLKNWKGKKVQGTKLGQNPNRYITGQKMQDVKGGIHDYP